MQEPTPLHYDLAHVWLCHTSSFSAWEEVHELNFGERWHLVKVMLAYAPDYTALGSVAAGPVEDLASSDNIALMVEEAKVNARFRVALGGAYVPQELARFAERPGEHAVLPPPNAVDATPAEIALMTAWFHHDDTFWAAHKFEEWNKNEPEGAFQVLRALLKLTEDAPHLRRDVFVHALDAFLRQNGAGYAQQINHLTRQYDALRDYLKKRSFKETPEVVE
jgi:hypothetical protein